MPFGRRMTQGWLTVKHWWREQMAKDGKGVPPEQPRLMPDDWDAGIILGTQNDESIALWTSHNGRLRLFIPLSGDADHDRKMVDKLRLSAWQALEMRRIFHMDD